MDSYLSYKLVLWIIVMLLSDSHSDGTHSLPLLRHTSPKLVKKQALLHLG